MEFNKSKITNTLQEFVNKNAAIGLIFDQSPGGKFGHALSRNRIGLKPIIKAIEENGKRVQEKNTEYVYNEKDISAELAKIEKPSNAKKEEIREKHKKSKIDKEAINLEMTEYLEGTTETVELYIIPLEAIEEAEKARGLMVTADGKHVYDDNGEPVTYKLFAPTTRFFEWAGEMIE